MFSNWGTVMCVVYRVDCWKGQCIWISKQLLAVCVGLYICGTMSHQKKCLILRQVFILLPLKN